jgi:hypothetical protein
MKIVLAKNAGVYKPGDLIELTNSETVLGPAYDDFLVFDLGDDVKQEDLALAIKEKAPTVKQIIKSNAPQGEWSFEPLEVAEVYQDGKDWKLIDKMPASSFNFDPAILASLPSSKNEKIEILKQAITWNAKEKNQTVTTVWEKEKDVK